MSGKQEQPMGSLTKCSGVSAEISGNLPHTHIGSPAPVTEKEFIC